MIILGNAFSLNMLNMEVEGGINKLRVKKINIEEVKELINNNPDFVSAIGHEATAKVLSKLLGITIVPQRISIKLNPDDKLVVFQLGVRLPEGFVIKNEEELAKLKFDFYLVESQRILPLL